MTTMSSVSNNIGMFFTFLQINIKSKNIISLLLLYIAYNKTPKLMELL